VAEAAKMATKTLHRNLHAAKATKNDEFYTQLSDIEQELKHYKRHFQKKVVFCNCDDPRISNFFHYFSYNFEALRIKKLITTCYKSINPDIFSRYDSERAIYLEYNGDKNGDYVPNPEEIGIQEFVGDGDFRSQECIELLQEADIVVTNPPFSLFREYVAQLIEHEKKFLIIGNINAISYKECFELIKANKMWLGYNCARHFAKPDGTMYETARSFWYTNLDIAKRHEDVILYKSYLGNEQDYPKYENYDAININRAVDIPVDYSGHMGVPITFLDKYNPDQFELVGLGISNSGLEIGVQPYKLEHKKYRKEVQNRGAVDGDLYLVKNGVIEVPYARIIIKNKRL
jgi:hypothetical protein